MIKAEEFVLEGRQLFVVQRELDLERPIRHTATLAQEGNHRSTTATKSIPLPPHLVCSIRAYERTHPNIGDREMR